MATVSVEKMMQTVMALNLFRGMGSATCSSPGGPWRERERERERERREGGREGGRESHGGCNPQLCAPRKA